MTSVAPLAPADPLLEFRLSKAEEHIAEQERHIKILEEMVRDNRMHNDNKIQEIRDHYEKQERNRLMWGISSLGSLVILLGGVLWSYRAVIFKGGS